MRMKLLSATLAMLAVLALIPGSALAAFGFKNLDVQFSAADGSPEMQAGSHPYAIETEVAFNTAFNAGLGKQYPDGSPKNVDVFLPPGFVGDPTATPRCSRADFYNESCDPSTQVGVVDAVVGDENEKYREPVYNLVPTPGTAAELGFVVILVPVTIKVGVNPEPPYNVVASLNNVSQALGVFSSKVTLWGNPADSAHDPERRGCPGGCSVSPDGQPFLTSPRSCNGPGATPTYFKADSWEDPGNFVESVPVLFHDNSVPPNPLGFVGCEKLKFGPTVSAQMSTKAAESASGLDFHIDVDDPGLSSSTGLANADLQKAVVALPQGMTLNPSAANGLGACSSSAFAAEVPGTTPEQGCPEASKVGKVEVETPLLEGALLKGSAFVGTPESASGALSFPLYLVLREPQRGIFIKLGGTARPDPSSGQIVTTFENIPQVPFSHFRFHFNEGPRAPLVTPSTCGSYSLDVALTPSSGQAPIVASPTFEVTSGVNGAPCPSGPPPFNPGFSGGSVSNAAATFSPVLMRMTRADGDQELTGFSATFPPGLVGKLAGIAKCSDAAIEAAQAKTGAEEIASPSCPAGSKVGRVLAGAGVGSEPAYVGGSLYLAGPYHGAPLSIAAITPAVTGPFDLGVVVVREALRVNPITAEVEADGSASNSIPRALDGIPLRLRDLRVYADRPQFTLNPTNCAEESFRATLFGDGANPLDPSDDTSTALSDRFQAADCASLAYKPKIGFRMSGGLKRRGHPALKTTITMPAGSANMKRAVIVLPRSEFIDNARIGTPCTRPQFDANQCPPSSVLGTARAFTPLLDEPLEGPIYFRSNGGARPLPDIVLDLHGIIDVVAVGKVDSKVLSKSASRIRTSFDSLPDAPVSKVVVSLKGRKGGLLVNNTNLCDRIRRVEVTLVGQNSKRIDSNPAINLAGCPKPGKRKH